MKIVNPFVLSIAKLKYLNGENKNTMINKSKLLKKLQTISDTLFVDYSDEYACAQKVWKIISNDPTFIHKVHSAQVQWLLPTWLDKLGKAIPVAKNINGYRALSVDGSQIYPDRHQGPPCFLINVGTVSLAYGLPGKSAEFNSLPYVFMSHDEEDILDDNSVDMVNCKRQELEFLAGLELSLQLQEKNHSPQPDHPAVSDEALCEVWECPPKVDVSKGNTIILFDGSLIFWHLESKDITIKETFLRRYCAALHHLYKTGMLMACYISLPKNKELVNLIRLHLSQGKAEDDSIKQVEHVLDTAVAHFFLKPFERSIVFQNHSNVCKLYPEHLRPHFFYLHVGTEVGRVEIPAWIAKDKEKVDLVAQMVLDQCIKGNGYPVVIAEAHEQAVVKGPDREFFYHLIRKFGFDQKQRPIYSQKSMKKRSIGI